MHDIASRVAASFGTPEKPEFPEKPALVSDRLRSAPRRAAPLPHFAFEYGDGGAGDDTGIKHNWAALDAIEMVPRYGATPELPPVNVKLFGREYTAPLGIAPMGSPIVVWPGADKLFAQGGAARRRAVHARLSPAAQRSRRSRKSRPTCSGSSSIGSPRTITPSASNW